MKRSNNQAVNKKRVAVVTGASRGIGRAIALMLDKKGFITVLVSRRPEKIKGVLGGFSSRAVAAAADVSREREVAAMVKKVVKKFGRIDVLVNNAGFTVFKAIDEMGKSDFEKMVNVNLGGVFYCSREVVKQMKRQSQGGQIINISSIAAKIDFGAINSSRSLQCMVKSGMAAFAGSLQGELRNYNIKIATIYPGVVATKLLTELNTRDRAEVKKYALRPEDIAYVVWMIVNQSKNSNIAEIVVQSQFSPSYVSRKPSLAGGQPSRPHF